MFIKMEGKRRKKKNKSDINQKMKKIMMQMDQSIKENTNQKKIRI